MVVRTLYLMFLNTTHTQGVQWFIIYHIFANSVKILVSESDLPRYDVLHYFSVAQLEFKL